MKSRNQKAQDAYAAAHLEALSLLDELKNRIEDAKAPDEETHWGHVGDMAHMVEILKEALGHED